MKYWLTVFPLIVLAVLSPLPTRGMICISFPSDTLADLSGGALVKTEVTYLADTARTPILPVPLEYLAVFVETSDGCYWIICLNDPVNHIDPLGLAGYFFDGTWVNEDDPKDPVFSNVYEMMTLYGSTASLSTGSWN